ncbi:MAG TPA: TrkA family potassium uptake protein [Actinomycetota bacterium]|nr:TrkA family potassium uptake protein [Actinomycetota bacterium]
MHVVIAGCGRVGSDLTVSLSKQGHTVSVIDKNPQAFERLPPGFEGQTLVGMSFDRDTLEAAGIKEAGAFIAVTNGDNSNIVSARIAREHYNIEKVVARIYDPRRAEIYRRIGIPTVATVQWASAEINDLLFHGIEHQEFAIGDGDMVLLRLEIPSELAGKPVESLGSPGRALVVALDRMGGCVIPTEQLTFQQGDVAHVIVRRDALEELRERLKDTGEDH